MKIAILTLPLHTNYGGILQAYALKTTLEKFGHEVYLLDTNLNTPPVMRAIKKFFLGLFDIPKGSTAERAMNKIKHNTYIQYTKPFIDKHFPNRTEKFPNPSALEAGISKYQFDAFVVGSDQIWNPQYFPQIEVAFFSFLGNKPTLRISYAPSFGNNAWSYKPEKASLVQQLIKKFNSVSVREESGVALCSEHLGVEAKWVLDPTMLLLPNDYVNILPATTRKEKGEMFTYILDRNETKRKFIQTVVDKVNLKPYELDFKESSVPIPLEWGTKAKVEDWIYNFHTASFVITDSFHGTVFSILFNKPFLSIANKRRGVARFESLLGMFGLSNRLVDVEKEISKEVLNSKIDWVSVNSILNEKREKSLSYLKESLRDTI
jgi:hypothetical protein